MKFTTTVIASFSRIFSANTGVTLHPFFAKLFEQQATPIRYFIYSSFFFSLPICTSMCACTHLIVVYNRRLGLKTKLFSCETTTIIEQHTKVYSLLFTHDVFDVFLTHLQCLLLSFCFFKQISQVLSV